MKFRKKPVVIEAIQLTADTLKECCQFVGRQNISSADPDAGTFSIYTLEGSMRADVGDWIIKGVKGEFYPCKPDIFAATYEPLAAFTPAEPPQQERCGRDMGDGYICALWKGHEVACSGHRAEPQTPEPDERIYPCRECGAMRSKVEGGTTFTVCDECWDKHAAPVSSSARPHEHCHDLVCNGDRKHPRGAKGVGCSCRGREERAAKEAQAQASARPARTLKDYARHDAGCDYFKCVDCGDWWDDGMCICQPPKSSTCSCGLDALLSGGAQ